MQILAAGEKFYDFNKIREEIIRDTDAKTGKNHGEHKQYLIVSRGTMKPDTAFVFQDYRPYPSTYAFSHPTS